MLRPKELESTATLKWSVGTGVEVWEMFTAAIAGDLATIERMVEAKPELARCQFHYRTPLDFAVRENRVEVARFLIENGSDPIGLGLNDSLLKIAEDRGYVEMGAMLAETYGRVLGASAQGNEAGLLIRAGDMEGLRQLLDRSPGLLQVGDERGNQPIHWATMTRRIEIVDELARLGADLNARRQDGARPIHLCNGDYIYRGWRDVQEDVTATADQVLEHLIALGAVVDIWTAAHMGKIELVRSLVDGNPELVNLHSGYSSYYLGSGSALRNAAANGHLEIVRLLLERGADPNLREDGIAPNGHALYSAAANGEFEVAKLLLENGAYPSPEVENSADAVSRAISNEDEAMVELLCSYGAARGVHLLAYYGDVQTAAAVFAANPMKAEDAEALMNAAAQGHEAFVRLMLRYDLELPKKIDCLWSGDGAKTRELGELLFAHGMDARQKNWLGVTPLHEFARKGDAANATMFLEHGADLDARDEESGLTPLGWAMKFGKQEMVELFRRHGAK